MIWVLISGMALSALGLADGFKTIVNPGGGKITYGPLKGETSAQSAMGDMLRSLRDQFGEGPKLGRVVQDETGELLATFFSVTAKTDNDREVAGLVIVSVPHNGKARAAVLMDDAKRFPATLDEMLELLQAATARDAGFPSTVSEPIRIL